MVCYRAAAAAARPGPVAVQAAAEPRALVAWVGQARRPGQSK